MKKVVILIPVEVHIEKNGSLSAVLATPKSSYEDAMNRGFFQTMEEATEALQKISEQQD